MRRLLLIVFMLVLAVPTMAHADTGNPNDGLNIPHVYYPFDSFMTSVPIENDLVDEQWGFGGQHDTGGIDYSTPVFHHQKQIDLYRYNGWVQQDISYIKNQAVYYQFWFNTYGDITPTQSSDPNAAIDATNAYNDFVSSARLLGFKTLRTPASLTQVEPTVQLLYNIQKRHETKWYLLVYHRGFTEAEAALTVSTVSPKSLANKALSYFYQQATYVVNAYGQTYG